MRRFGFYLIAVLSLAGCEMQHGIAHFKPPPILADQSWQVVGKNTLPSGGRICTVSPGEIEVTQWKHGRDIAAQVTYYRPLAPGERYKILFGDHVYETLTGKFKAADSQAIIRQLKSNPTVYTEQVTPSTRFGGWQYERMQNIIPQDDFVARYRECTRYVRRG